MGFRNISHLEPSAEREMKCDKTLSVVFQDLTGFTLLNGNSIANGILGLQNNFLQFINGITLHIFEWSNIYLVPGIICSFINGD